MAKRIACLIAAGIAIINQSKKPIMDQQEKQRAIDEILFRCEQQVRSIAHRKEEALKELVLRAKKAKVARLSKKIKG